MLKKIHEQATKFKNPNSLRPSFTLDEDAERGFMMAVNSNQNNLAMQYLIVLLGDLQEKVASLEEAAAAKPETRKPATKKETSDQPQVTS